MRNFILILLASYILASCSFLPVPLQVASWAVDGISVVVTKKSLSDHGLSIITQKDCAVWRGFAEGAICREVIKLPILAKQPGIKLSKPYLEII